MLEARESVGAIDIRAGGSKRSWLISRHWVNLEKTRQEKGDDLGECSAAVRGIPNAETIANR
jgi:hypothetical protein